MLISHYGIGIESQVPEKIQTIRRKTVQDRYNEIRQAVNSGLDSVDAIAEQVGLASSTVRMYASVAGIELPKKPRTYEKTKEDSYNAIRQAVDSGLDSVDAIAEQVGLASSTVIVYASEAGIELSVNKQKGTKRRPELDELIELGATQVEIGQKGGFTRENARRYINGTGQHEKWIENREKVPREQKFRLISALKSMLDYLVQEEPFAGQKTFQYVQSTGFNPKTNTSKIRLYELITFFERYKEAKNSGKKLGLYGLTQGLSITAQNAGRILHRVGLEPLYGNKDIHGIPTEKKEAILRAYGLEMPRDDIAYFLGIPDGRMRHHIRKIGNKSKISLRNIASIRNLTYRLASQIYEAQDLGFNENEIAQLFDKKEAVVNHEIENRELYQKTIINALRVLYVDNSINKPYMK